MAGIEFECTSCGSTLKAGADKAGQRCRCTRCGQSLTIPTAEPPAPTKTAGDRPRTTRTRREPDREPQREESESDETGPEDEERPARRTDPRLGWRRTHLGLTLLLYATLGGLLLGMFACVASPSLLFTGTGGLGGILLLGALTVLTSSLHELVTLAAYWLCSFVPPRYGSGKLARIALIVGGVSFAVDATGSITAAVWTWKSARALQVLADPQERPRDPKEIMRESQEMLAATLRWSWVETFTLHLRTLMHGAQYLAFAFFLQGLTRSLELHEATANCEKLIQVSVGLLFAGVFFQIVLGIGLLSPLMFLRLASIITIPSYVMGLLGLARTIWFIQVVYSLREVLGRKVGRPRRKRG
jgi:hypothetical protein